MTNQISTIILILLAGQLYGLSKRSPQSQSIKAIAKYGWLIVLGCFIAIISQQVQHPLGVLDVLSFLIMLLVGLSIANAWRKNPHT